MSEADGKQAGPGGFLNLGRRQQVAVATALTILAAAIIITSVLGLGWVLTQFFRRFSHVFLPLAVGGIMALVFKPYYGWLRTKLNLPVGLAVVGMLLSILIPLAGFGWFFGSIAVDQISDLVTRFPAWWKKTAEEAQQRWPAVQDFLRDDPWGQRIGEVIEGQKENLVSGAQIFGSKALSAGAGIFRGIGSLASWAVFPIYFLFFLVVDPKGKFDLDAALPFLKPETRKDVRYLIREFIDIIVAFFRGQLIIAFLQGLLYAIGFSAIGLRYGFVLGLLLGLLNIIPYLGSIIGLGIGLPLAYFQDRRRTG